MQHSILLQVKKQKATSIVNDKAMVMCMRTVC